MVRVIADVSSGWLFITPTSCHIRKTRKGCKPLPPVVAPKCQFPSEAPAVGSVVHVAAAAAAAALVQEGVTWVEGCQIKRASQC